MGGGATVGCRGDWQEEAVWSRLGPRTGPVPPVWRLLPFWRPSWQAPQQAGGEGDPLEALAASLMAAQPRRSPSSQALALLEPPEVLVLQRGGAPLPAWRRVLLWLPSALGVKPQCFSVALQLVVAYTAGGC